MTTGFYMQYLESLCRRRGWTDPSYECYQDHSGYTCLVLVNGRHYQTDLAYESDRLAQENAAMRAFMVCRNFSVNGGMLARNGIVQGLPAEESSLSSSSGRKHRSGHRKPSSSSSSSGTSHHHGKHHGKHSSSSLSRSRSGHHSSSSSTTSLE